MYCLDVYVSSEETCDVMAKFKNIQYFIFVDDVASMKNYLKDCITLMNNFLWGLTTILFDVYVEPD